MKQISLSLVFTLLILGSTAVITGCGPSAKSSEKYTVPNPNVKAPPQNAAQRRRANGG